MVVEQTPKFGMKRYTAGTDPHPTRTDHNAERDLLDLYAARIDRGTLAARPPAGTGNRFYWTTEAPTRLFYDDGASWQEVSSNGGGGAGVAVVVGGSGSEGSSTRSARADHTHPLPLATASVNGAMVAADKAKLDGAVSAATASRLMIRDASGRVDVATPTASTNAANKGYVDQIGLNAASGIHSHPGSDITSGIIGPEYLPAVTTTVQGVMSPADKVKLDGATSVGAASRVMMRDGSGRSQVVSPSLAADIATKGYVDGEVGTRAPTTHNHSWSQITSGIPATFAPSAHTHGAGDVSSGTFSSDRLPLASGVGNGAMSSADKNKLDGATNQVGQNRIMMRDANGNTDVVDPTGPAHAASKGYVDRTRAPISHTHSWNDIYDRPASYQPNGHTHPGSNITSDISAEHIIGSTRAWSANDAGSTYATVAVRPDGLFARFPSSIRYKENIRPLPFDPETFARFAHGAVVYDRIDGSLIDEPGFIAEDVVDLYPRATYRESLEPDARVEGINHDRLVIPAVQAAQYAIERADEALAALTRLRLELGK